MALTYCEQCGAIEGKTYIRELFIPFQVEAVEEEVCCAECDSTEPISYVPEHDDSDMER